MEDGVLEEEHTPSSPLLPMAGGREGNKVFYLILISKIYLIIDNSILDFSFAINPWGTFGGSIIISPSLTL